jgi:HPr kinase/phosphorylase
VYSITVKQFADEYRLKLLAGGDGIAAKLLRNAEINRPALQLAGFFDYFNANMIQVIGLVEYTYLSQLGEWERVRRVEKLFEYDFPCLVVSRGLSPFPEFLELAESKEVPLLQTEDPTNEFCADAMRWLKDKLAPRQTIHGVLVDCYGEGVLITGESGIGKSETALELVKRGHRLVADDAVEIKRLSSRSLIGTSPDSIRYFIELRGIGIIDIKQMFGVGAVKAAQYVDLVIKLEAWDETREYDRLGLNDDYMDILGNGVVCLAIPVRPGRNLAIICEAAAINHRQKKMGYNAARAMLGGRFI